MSADKVFHTNADGRGNELRNWSLEKLAADPTGAKWASLGASIVASIEDRAERAGLLSVRQF